MSKLSNRVCDVVFAVCVVAGLSCFAIGYKYVTYSPEPPEPLVIEMRSSRSMESPDEGVTIEQLVEALKQPIPPGTSGDPIFTIDPSGDIE